MSPIYLRNRSEAWGHTCCAQALARGDDEVPGSNHGERESLSQLAGRIRGIEDEVKLREGKVGKRGRERERERTEKRREKKERISPSSTFRQRRPIRPGRIPHWARPVDQITSLHHYHYYC